MKIKSSYVLDICQVMNEVISYLSSEMSNNVLKFSLENNVLKLRISDSEKSVELNREVENSESFNFIVDSTLFLQLITKLTTEYIDFEIKDNKLILKGNGEYEFNLLKEEDVNNTLETLNTTNLKSFKIDNKLLKDIYNYNSKELSKSGLKHFVQNMYYLDNKGCITFTSGACVTKYDVDTEFRVLLNKNIVRMFNLFKSESVYIEMSDYNFSDSIKQIKLTFKDDNITYTTMIKDDNDLFNRVPVNIIRNMINNIDDSLNTLVVDKRTLLETLRRLSIFSINKVITSYTHIEIKDNYMIIYDNDKVNYEKIKLENNTNIEYNLLLNTVDLITTIESQDCELISIKFGNEKSIIFNFENIYNILPECHFN